jgi:hypothetical protein
MPYSPQTWQDTPELSGVGACGHDRHAPADTRAPWARCAWRPVLELNPAHHAALVADGWEGTVAKRTTGRYRCGHRSSAWVKLKSPAARDRDQRRFALTRR